jgi:ATP/maltotriose-dependent transcriptional regulator MalT
MSAAVAAAPFVGRRAELARLHAALSAAAAGRPSAVLVSGEAGVGKTRLVAEFSDQVRDAGVLVLAGNCVPFLGAGLPYAALTEALRDLLPRTGAALADLLGGQGGPEATADPFATAPAPDRLSASLLRALRGGADTATAAVLVIEDLHWADRSTLQLLAFLVANLRSERLLVVLTQRTDVAEDDAEARAVLAELGRQRTLDRIDLLPFTAEEVTALVTALLGEDVDPTVAGRVLARSDGNAFLVGELLAAYSGGVDGPVPRRVSDLLGARLAALPVAAKHLLGVAAAAARAVDHRLLTAASGLAAEEAAAALRAAVQHAALVAEAAPGVYRFRHALLQEVVYERLLPGERQALHRNLARALEADPDLGPPDPARAAAELADHWDRGGDGPRALAALARAGAATAATHAHHEALRHFEAALRWWPRVPDPEAIAGLARAGLLDRAAEAARWSGDVARATALVREALAEAADDATCATRWIRLGVLRWAAGDGAGSLSAYEEAGKLLAGADPLRHARVLAAQAGALMADGHLGEAAVVAEQARALAERVGSSDALSHALNTLGVLTALEGDIDAGVASLERARRLAEAPLHEDNLGRAHVNLAYVLGQAGRLVEALRVAETGLRWARAHGRELIGGGVLHINLAQFLLWRGRWEELEALAGDLLGRGAPPRSAFFLRMTLGELATARGDLDGAAAVLAEARRRAEAEGMEEPQFWAPFSGALAQRALEAGDLDAAGALAAEGLRVAGEEERHLAVRLAALAVGVEAERADRLRADTGAGRQAPVEPAAVADRARSLYAAAEAAAGPRPSPDAAAHLATARAELARVEGRPAADAWAAAAAAWAELQRPYAVASARWRQGAALLAGARSPAAASLLGEAHGIAVRLGAVPLADRIARLARRARVRLGDGPAAEARDARPADPFGLTPREREVLALVTRGRTNRQIAHRLFITEKTASVHVSNLLAKLGVANRREAAAVAHRLRLVPAEDEAQN